MTNLAIPGITEEMIGNILEIMDSEKNGKIKLSSYTDAV